MKITHIFWFVVLFITVIVVGTNSVIELIQKIRTVHTKHQDSLTYTITHDDKTWIIKKEPTLYYSSLQFTTINNKTVYILSGIVELTETQKSVTNPHDK